MISNPLEDPFYYLKNFQHVLDWIAARYDDVLSVEEQQFISGFARLPGPSQALWVRMLMRKGRHFRASKLNYPEIGDPLQAAAPLVAQGWIDDRAPLTLAELFDVLQKPEILTRFGANIVLPKARKSAWLDGLAGDFPQPQSFADWHPALSDVLYTLNNRALGDRLRLMFFGNLSQSWSDLVLADLGLFTYEKVDFNPQSRALRCRADIDGYLHLYACREQFEAGAEVGEVLQQVLDYAADNRWLQRRRARLLFQLGQHLERAGELSQALNVYRQSQYPEARLRVIRVLELLGDCTQALALAEAAEQAPLADAEHQQLLRSIPRLRRKVGLAALARPRARPPERLELTLAREESTPVELKVVAHLHRAEAPVHYVENTLINGLFGLLCWPAIFAALPGAFFHPYQSGPADLLEDDFYQRRAAIFEDCLAQLEDGRYQTTIRAVYASRYGVQSPFVAWSYLSESLLEEALLCLPPAHLNLWFRRLLQDIKANRTGMPDLIQFWPAQNTYRMIEVKGPGDRLQDNQLRWLAFCEQHQMPVTVCYVQWQEPDA
ncbi:VRR-NUC domain-containing protein [Pseudomonas taetrolens]|uniref:phosphodiesterase I n=1 Tax=Pseudomonas taetrolens TaxID=47884 RepID=A0A0J6GTB0_PSETA|nr:VRR-NUC domain-containing protein [Pseudomonas taetrolens]KMM85334.1 nuclease [Pseudomonas taetrolens]SEC35889.1 VRR-NUC domain-containing protein [Pseudomonas taetrolens]SQF86416.1 VRR-NUC domain-containing protein [Pseudomonas taetrolens]VEH49493.1 VRR-NUC domain-containing protein [Pseudomonas taetrolens]